MLPPNIWRISGLLIGCISSTKTAFHAFTVLQSNRSVYLLNLDTDASSYELTVETHPVKTRLIVCAANVSPASDS